MPRERSYWGWGWADKLPDLDMRRALGERISALFGVSGLEPRALPSIDDVALPPARVVPELACCTSDPHTRIRHTHGRSYRDLMRGFHGDFARAPDVVALPRSEDEVSAVLAWCAERRVAAIPFGGGTSVVSGVEADVGGRFSGVCARSICAR
jgi:alkyldihydroxyacetonephosphate synthase